MNLVESYKYHKKHRKLWEKHMKTVLCVKELLQAYGGRVDPTNVELAIEDARPLPTTK